MCGRVLSKATEDFSSSRIAQCHENVDVLLCLRDVVPGKGSDSIETHTFSSILLINDNEIYHTRAPHRGRSVGKNRSQFLRGHQRLATHHGAPINPVSDLQCEVCVPGKKLSTLRARIRCDFLYMDGGDTNRHDQFVLPTPRTHENFLYHILRRILHTKLEWDRKTRVVVVG